MVMQTMVVAALCLAMLAGCGKRKSDLSSPKATAKSLSAAVLAGDATAARACFLTSNDQQGKAADAVVAALLACRKFQDAAAVKFGDAGKKLTSENDPLDLLQNAQSAQEQINGDTASLTGKAGRPMWLKKVAGEWKVDLTRAADDEGSGVDVKATGVLQTMAGCYKAMAEDIGNGKYKTADEVRAAMGERMRDALLK